jgi:hypothetical protein
MGAELGRISGPLLSANLLRQGVDLAFETDLLYLKVSPSNPNDPNPTVGPNAIGINNDGPVYDLDVLGTTNFNNLLALTSANLANFTISSATIANAVGNVIISPNQLLDPTVITRQLQVGNLNFFDRSVLNTTVDANLVLDTTGSGQVVFNSTKVNVNGNLHATGDITYDGNITFGNNDLDSVDFNSDFTSDITPDAPNQYDLGSFTKQWQTLRTNTLVTELVTTDSLSINGIDLLSTQGKIIYVSINGSDSNLGSHQHSTVRTVKHALSIAQPGDEVSLFPGIYQEQFPLTVPAGVSINGTGLRSVTVVPTAATNRNDAFLLNGETTVAGLTIRNFYYDSVNDTGYGFRLAPNCRVTTRSPYVQNVSVLNRGTLTDNRAILDGGNAVTILFDAILEGGTAFSTYIDELNGGPASLSAGLGFASGDAGRGALVDGAVVHPDSKEATILFHSVTFIVPNADGITAKNGARVEWLNSFTYFANRGIYLTEGTEGFASLGVRYGAEMRSINSANVYGNYGAVADGPSTLGYLIGHNFGYIGTGADSQNDPRLVIQANEVVAINNAELYYDSMDHKGDYRVGDIFYVSQETGRISFNAQRIDFSAQGSIVLEGPGGITIVEATGIQNSNIRIHDNNVDSLSGPVNFLAFSGNTYLNTDVFVTGAMNISNNVYVDGNVFLGNDPLDLITVAPNLTETIEPRLNNTYSLGSDNGVTPKRWDVAYLGNLNIDAITQIDNNTISTLTNDYDLRFTAAGTGKVVVSSTDVQLDQQLTVVGTFTVNGTTSLRDTELVGTVNQTGNILQTGDTDVTGTVQTNNLIVTNTAYLLVPDIKFIGHEVQATTTDADIVFNGTGTAGVVLDQRLKIKDNIISNVWSGATTDLQKSIQLTPNGSGNIVISSNKSLTVPYGNNTNRALSAVGEIRQNSTSNWFEGYKTTGNVSFNNLYDTDLNTYIIPEPTPGANDSTLRFGINGTERVTITPTKLTTSKIVVDSIDILSNTINNNTTASDLTIIPDGAGYINMRNLLVRSSEINNQASGAISLVSTGNGYIKFGGTGGVRLPIGNDSERRLTPEVGETRYSSQRNYMEVYNGSIWIPAVGTLGAASLNDVLEIFDFWSLTLG